MSDAQITFVAWLCVPLQPFYQRVSIDFVALFSLNAAMQLSSLRYLSLIAVSVAWACLALGCGDGGEKYVPVTGKLTVNGQPYDPAAQDEVMVILYPAVDTGSTYPATVNPNGSFKVPGVESKGVPPGKYTISLERMADDRKQPVQVDLKYKGRTSVLQREVSLGNGDVGTIDVTKAP
jgi:hypothetical protein